MLPDRYTLDNLAAALRKPTLLWTELRRVLSYRAFTAIHGEGVDVTEREWDTLVILDACRYDVFAERIGRTDLRGDLSRVRSRGPESWIFLSNTFLGGHHHDTVYVTANPHASRLPDDTFFRVEPLLDCWDPAVETIRPGDVVAATRRMHERYPNKRLVVHFMQPHLPYIGETAERIRERVDIDGLGVGPAADGEGGANYRWWDAVEAGEITREQTRAAYVESLDIVLAHVERLLDALDGKSVVTADHGEYLGERLVPFGPRRYGHPPIHTSTLRTVPWFEVEFDRRREVVAEEPVSADRLDSETVDRRLRALGYTD